MVRRRVNSLRKKRKMHVKVCMYLVNLAISIWNLFCNCSTKGKSSKKKQNILNYGSGAEEDDEDDNRIDHEIDDYDTSDEYSGIDLLCVHFACITFLVSVISNKYVCICH